MKCGTYGICPFSRREQNEVDDFYKSTSRDKSTNRDSPKSNLYFYFSKAVLPALY